MGINFGSLTKVDFKIQTGNTKAQQLQAEYNEQWNVFEEAKKAEENAQNGTKTSTTMSIDELTAAREEAENKLISLQTTLAEETNGKQNQQSPDDKEKNKIQGSQFKGMMA